MTVESKQISVEANFNSEHLHYTNSGLPTVTEILAGNLNPPEELTYHLQLALRLLLTHPGPNHEYRQETAQQWIEPWIGIMENLTQRNIPNIILQGASRVFASPYDIGTYLKDRPLLTPGAIYMGGGEGTPGHRYCLEYMQRYCNYSVVLLSGESYKQRGLFFPRSLLVQLWAYFFVHHNQFGGITIMKDDHLPPDELSKSAYYKEVFLLTGARYCFATENDPHAQDKIGRGQVKDFLLIPELPFPHTSFLIRKLHATGPDF